MPRMPSRGEAKKPRDLPWKKSVGQKNVKVQRFYSINFADTSPWWVVIGKR